MASGVGAQDDFIKRFIRLEEKVRRLEIRIGQSESRTFIVGSFDASTFIPPLTVSIDPNDELPEVRVIYGFRGTVRTGSCTLQWLLNDVEIYSPHDVTTTPGQYDYAFDTPVVLSDGDRIRPVVTDVFGTPDGLEATVVFAIAPR
jgi:hypothetical protein